MTKQNKVAWDTAHKLLGDGVWIDPSTIPVGGGTKRAGRVLRVKGLEEHGGGEKTPAGEWVQLRRGIRDHRTPSVATALALLHKLNVPPKRVAEILDMKPERISRVAGGAWDRVKPERRAIALKTAKRLHQLSEGRRTWKDAVAAIGSDIDRDTIPNHVYLSVAAAKLVKLSRRKPVKETFGEKSLCDICGDARTTDIKNACEKCRDREKNRIHHRMKMNRYEIPRGAIISKALAEGLDAGYLSLVLGVTPQEIKREQKGKGNYSERELQRAAMFVQLIIDLYGRDAFPVIASGKAGEVRLGRLNKWHHAPKGVVVISERDKEFLDLWATAKHTIREIGAQLGVKNGFNFMKSLQRKFGVSSTDALSDKLKAFGLQG